MTAASETTRAKPRYRLRTLGTLALADIGEGTVLGEHGHQRRRLALLAVLAAAGSHGRSRDQLLGLFWPDVDQGRARHSLDQLLYALRTSVDPSVFAGTNPLRLNGEVVDSDVQEFTTRLERGELAEAVQSYGGAFLDGFYLGDAPDFEQWVDSERRGLERRFTDALDRLARNAQAEKDYPAAIQWWRKLTEVDPVSSRNALGLMQALRSSGDHASALKYAERYEHIVAQELGTGVGQAFSELVGEIRDEARTEGIAGHGSATRPALDTSKERSRAATTRPPQALQAAESIAGAGSPPEAPRTLVGREPAPNLLAEGPGKSSNWRSRVHSRAAVFYVSAALVLLASASAAIRLRTQSGGTGHPQPSIAVLPLGNLSTDPRDSPLADGLTEELIGVLARIERLRVIGRTSTSSFASSGMNMRAVADSLGVSHVLEGSVQKVGRQLRVQVRLVDADGSTRWSETYDRELQDVFAVQSEIASSVARELDLRLTERALRDLRRGPTQNIAAYELYLRGRDPLNFRIAGGPEAALQYLQQAITLDSGFAAAYANLPYMYYVLAARANLARARELKVLAEAAAQKAVTLDPLLPESHTAVGMASLIGRSDLRTAEAAFKRALSLPGYSRAHEHLANVYMWTGRPADGLAEVRRALEKEPLSATAAADLGNALCVNGRPDEGLAQLRKLAQVRPPVQRAAVYAGMCYGMQRMWTDAIHQFRSTQDPRSEALLGYALARAGQTEEAERVHAQAVARQQHAGRGAFEIAVVAAGLRDYDRAFAWLQRSIDDLSINGHIMHPLFADLHADPRFARIREHFGVQNR